jgi:peptidoglycan hydrolase CwlO-like protein
LVTSRTGRKRAGGARAPVGELGRQIRRLEEQLTQQEASVREAQESYREKVRAVSNGESLEGLVARKPAESGRV